MAEEFRTAGIGKAVEGRLPDDNIAFRMEDSNTPRLESEKSKHPEFWCKVNIDQLTSKNKRDRGNGNVCIVTAMADSEYDGGFTGEVHTESGTISLHHLGVSDTPREFYDAVWPQVEITEEEAAELRGVIDSKNLISFINRTRRMRQPLPCFVELYL